MMILISLLLAITPVISKLYFAASLANYGARYPINDYYDGSQLKPNWGEITPVGLRHHAVLGSYFRTEFIDNQGLLSGQYVQNESELYSTNSNRTIESALSLGFGIYGLKQGERLIDVPRAYHLPPFSNKTDLQEQNYALPGGSNILLVRSSLLGDCPNANLEANKNIQLQLVEYKEMNLTYQPFIRKMATLFGIQAANFTILSQIYDTLRADLYLNRPLPPLLSADDLANLDHIHNWYLHFTVSHNLSKMYNANKFTKIINDFDARIKNGSPLRWTHFSGQEQDLVGMQVDLNISSSTCIEDLYRKNSSSSINCERSVTFASTIVVELHSDNGSTFYVKIRNDGKYIYPCVVNQLTCAYSDWRQRVKRLIVSNPEAICGKTQTSIE